MNCFYQSGLSQVHQLCARELVCDIQAGTSYGQGGGGYSTPVQNRGYAGAGGGYGAGSTAGAYAAPVQANTYGAANTYGGVPSNQHLCCPHDMVACMWSQCLFDAAICLLLQMNWLDAATQETRDAAAPFSSCH